MLFLIPLGADRPSPRLPRATLALIVLNTLVFVLTTGAGLERRSVELDEISRIAEHSLRGFPAATQDRAREYSSALEFVAQDSSWPAEATIELDRERLTACRQDYLRIKQEHPFYRFGFLPSQPSLTRLVTHQFLHADFLHLFFNMLFLWAVGGLLEATLGFGWYLPFVLLSGFAAAAVHAVAHPGSAEPAIGASGAVAGVMGACAALHARDPLRIALVAGLGLAPRITILSLPVVVVLGLWLLEQIFMAAFRSSALNIAFEAHIGGFVFGLVAAGSFWWWQRTRGEPR